MKSKMIPDLSIIVVTTNAIEHIENCLSSIISNVPPPETEIIISDNQSTDGTVELVREKFPDVKIIIGENNGYGAGNNRGMKESKGRFIFVLNDDTLITDDSLLKMINYMESHQDVGLLGPKLLELDGTLQPSITNFPHFYNDLLHEILPRKLQINSDFTRKIFHKFIKPMTGWRMGRYDDHAAISEVDCVKGAALFVRREVFEVTGGFDEGIFIDTEEQGWSIKILNAGWKVIYYPEARIVHLTGRTLGRFGGLPTKRYIQKYKSNLFFYEKHYSKWYASIFKLSLTLPLLFKILVLSITNIFRFSEGKYRNLKEREIYLKTLKMFYSIKFRNMNILTEVDYKYN